MRPAISALCGCLVLGWAVPVAAGEGPPVQRPSSRAEQVPEPVEPAPVVETAPVVEPAPVEPAVPPPPSAALPDYRTPVVVDVPAAVVEKPRDRPSEAMIVIGSLLVCGGTLMGVFALLEWQDQQIVPPWDPGKRRLPAALGGAGISVGMIGATVLGLGIARDKRWKSSLKKTQAVQVQPTLGFGQIGVVGRF